MNNNRISKLGREQIESAKEIIICKSTPYYVAKLGKDAPTSDRDRYIALAVFTNGLNQTIYSGELQTWKFDDLKNGIRSIKRINNKVSIRIYSDDDILRFVAAENAERTAFIEAARKFNNGDKSELINLLSEDA